MRGTLLFAGALFLIAFMALVGQTTTVAAMGAPTENYTIPNIPTGDQSSPEIVPSVNYVLQGPTSQPQSTPPSFIPGFIGASEDRSRVTANENWYLNVDINAPGWLYIYEYFPAGNNFQGKWIAYKWQLLESGLWRLGPFTPENNEAEGQHIYRIWFYSDGQWAAEDPDAPQRNLVYWTYVKSQPDEQTPQQQPPVLARKTTFLAQVYKFVTMPVVLFGFSALVVISLGLYLFKSYARRRRIQDTSLPAGIEHEEPSATLQSAAASAKIALTNGMEIGFAGNSRVIGRGDLARVLGLDELGLISRRHFEIKYEQEQFYIEDLGSANGTRLNGVDIGGKGLVILNDDDVIEPAGAISVKFYIL